MMLLTPAHDAESPLEQPGADARMTNSTPAVEMTSHATLDPPEHMCASRQLQYDMESGDTSSDMTSHSISTYYQDGMNAAVEDKERADYPSSESWEPTPRPRRRPKRGVGVPVLPKKKMIHTAAPAQKGGRRGRAQHDERALVLRKRMAIRKQVVMPTVGSKKRHRIAQQETSVYVRRH